MRAAIASINPSLSSRVIVRLTMKPRPGCPAAVERSSFEIVGHLAHLRPQTLLPTENILNWRVERINGRNIPTLVVLLECEVRNAELGTQESASPLPSSQRGEGAAADPFASEGVEQIRVLKPVAGGYSASETIALIVSSVLPSRRMFT
jgi:hypothetical protein